MQCIQCIAHRLCLWFINNGSVEQMLSTLASVCHSSSPVSTDFHCVTFQFASSKRFSQLSIIVPSFPLLQSMLKWAFNPVLRCGKTEYEQGMGMSSWATHKEVLGKIHIAIILGWKMGLKVFILVLPQKVIIHPNDYTYKASYVSLVMASLQQGGGYLSFPEGQLAGRRNGRAFQEGMPCKNLVSIFLSKKSCSLQCKQKPMSPQAEPLW